MRIGIVPYINALPLCFYLDLPCIKATPVELDLMMQKGKLDIALLPTFSFFQNDYFSLAEAGIIQSDGPVRSVNVFYKKNLGSPAEIRSIGFTSESRTSVALFRILYSQLWKGNSSQLKITDKDPDAFLHIGDRALLFDNPDFKSVDLGQVWKEWTNLPFVYALWVSRIPVPDDIRTKLMNARQRGRDHIDEIIETQRDFSPKLLRPYLTKAIQYEMKPLSIEGIKLFQELCVKEGLLKKKRDLQF